MPLTAAQVAGLDAHIQANTATAPGTSGQISALAHTPDTAFAIAAWYNQYPGVDYFVWDHAVDVDVILDSITGANYDPLDVPDNTVTYQNRALICEMKQISLQILLQGRNTLNAGKKNIRAWLNSATTNIPSGAGGATRSGGWNVILPLLSRKARNVEKIVGTAGADIGFAFDDGAGIGNNTSDARGLNTNPDTARFVGEVSDSDIRQVWGI